MQRTGSNAAAPQRTRHLSHHHPRPYAASLPTPVYQEAKRQISELQQDLAAAKAEAAHWRDQAERGRTPDSVIGQYLATVRPGHERLTEPSKTHADFIVADATAADLYAAIDLLADKLDRMAVKLKEKMKDHHRGESAAKQEKFG